MRGVRDRGPKSEGERAGGAPRRLRQPRSEGGAQRGVRRPRPLQEPKDPGDDTHARGGDGNVPRYRGERMRQLSIVVGGRRASPTEQPFSADLVYAIDAPFPRLTPRRHPGKPYRIRRMPASGPRSKAGPAAVLRREECPRPPGSDTSGIAATGRGWSAQEWRLRAPSIRAPRGRPPPWSCPRRWSRRRRGGLGSRLRRGGYSRQDGDPVDGQRERGPRRGASRRDP